MVAPGGYAVDPAAYARGVARLADLGGVLHNYYDPERIYQRFGGTDEGRAGQLRAALRDPDVQVIMALRGAYGISRILPDIDFEAFAASGKIVVGYSDVTAFHLGLLATTGACSYAGPMLCDDFTRETPVDYTLDQLRACLLGPTHSVHGAGQGNPVLDVEGTLWGGNLAMILSLVGTPWMPRVDGGILFIEDVNEHPYRIERMLLQLHYAGLLEGLRALVIGQINNYKANPMDNGYDEAAMVAYLRERLPLPVLTGLPFGHVAERATLPVGARCRLHSDGNAFSLTLSDYTTLRHA
nr:LD-carboxypeptidase [Massilia sp. TS11]